MKEKEFLNELVEMNFNEGLVIKIYYALDEKGNIILDEEGMKEEFEMKIRDLNNILD